MISDNSFFLGLISDFLSQISDFLRTHDFFLGGGGGLIFEFLGGPISDI